MVGFEKRLLDYGSISFAELLSWGQSGNQWSESVLDQQKSGSYCGNLFGFDSSIYVAPLTSAVLFHQL